MAQATYSQSPIQAKRGMIPDAGPGDDIVVALAAATIPGRLLIRSNQTVSPIPVAEVPVASAADADAIIVTGGSTAGIQSLVAADFDGAIGAGYFNVPAFITMTFSSHADWNATTATITGILADGSVGTDTIAIPDAGNAAVTGDVSFWKITGVSIPAQAGTGGTFTMGVAATGRDLTAAQVLGVAKRDSLVIDDDELQVTCPAGARRRGRICVETDETVLVGAAAFVRVITDGVKLVGMFRDDADSGAAVALSGAHFTRVFSATAAEIQLDGGY
jgi:hypothetical protein